MKPLSTEFDFKKQAALYIPTHLPDYRNPGYLPKAAEEIRNILAVSEGRAFVLFTSYHQMQACYKNTCRRTALSNAASRSNQ